MRTARLVGLCAAPVLAAAALLASAGDFERGKALYNARCVGCHDRSVHQREARKAMTIEGIKAQVRRWDAFLNGAWRDERGERRDDVPERALLRVPMHAGDLSGEEGGARSGHRGRAAALNQPTAAWRVCGGISS